MITVNLEQNTPEWLAEKLGKPSASNCSKIVTPQGKPSKQREGYMYELAAERITGSQAERYYNAEMEEGHRREQEARDLFCMLNNVTIETVGVVYPDNHKKFLCSPDGFVNRRELAYKEGIEIKNPLPKTQAKYLHKDNLLAEYFCQVQFSLLVTGVKMWHLFSYVPAMKHVHIIVKPDTAFQSALYSELESFCKELDEVTEKIR